MAKQKASRSKANRKPAGWKGIWWVVLVVLAGTYLFWQWSGLSFWANNVVNGIWLRLGWGLALIIICVGVLLGLVWQRKLASLFSHFNRWLGGIVFVLAAWGVLALLGMGGSFGEAIIDYPSPDFIGIFRVLGLAVIGGILFAPGAFFRLAVGFFSWLGRQFERRPAPVSKPLPRMKPTSPPVATISRHGGIKPEAESNSVTPTPPAMTSATSPRTAPVTVPEPEKSSLMQVAQDVWKKYGESPDLITIDGWRLPPIDILDKTPEVELSEADNLQRAKLIEDAIASYGVDAKVVQINAGPTVTQFGVEPGWDRKFKEKRERDKEGNVRVTLQEVSKTRVKVDKVTALANDLALALAAPSIRIEAPVPGTSVIGIEVPNVISSAVGVRGVIESSVFQRLLAKNKLSLALGKGAGGEVVSGDLTRMPHLLIAGATGSGKTVCLNSIVCCLLLHNTPNDVRLIMIDPKRVELTPYNSIPHLAAPVIVNTDKALSALRWLNQQMDQRYKKLAEFGARNIEAYNRNRQGTERMPYLILIIDELADLMMAGFDEVEHILCRLAQLARATGIHLVVATQRPSVDVVTGLIKANFPTRISFAVTSQIDSRTILDFGGAEKLLGRGDMLYMPTEASKPKRLQGCFVSDAETERLVYFWGGQKQKEAAQLKVEEVIIPPATGKRAAPARDPLLETARKLVEEHTHISTSFLQRKLRIGYPRAARIMEQLDEEDREREGEG